MSIHLDAFTAPQPFHPTPVKDEEEERNQPTLSKVKTVSEDNQEENATNTDLAWHGASSRLWYAQAAALKARGSAIYNSKIAGGTSAAFTCYSRALQLVTLLSASIGLTTRAEEKEGKREPCEVMFGSVVGDYINLDEDTPYPIDPDQVILDPGIIEKMHFK